MFKLQNYKIINSISKPSNQGQNNLAAGKTRIECLDYAKGIGIFLVVLDHVISGALNSEIIPYSSLVWQIKLSYNSFFMPLFFVMSGFFSTKSISKPFSTVLTTKLRTLAYPYIVWSLIQKCTLLIFAAHVNNPELSNPFEFAYNFLLQPYQHLWFIYVLLIINLGYLVLCKLGVTNLHFLFFAAFIYCIWGMTDAISLASTNTLTQICSYSIFFALGAWIGSTLFTAAPGKLRLSFKAHTLLAVAMVGYALIVVVSLSPFTYGTRVTVLIAYLFTGSVGTLATLALCLWLTQTFKPQNLAFLQFLGLLSLEIYLAHLIATAGIRIILFKGLGITSSMLHLIAGLIFGLGFPIILKLFFERIGFRYAFIFPASRN